MRTHRPLLTAIATGIAIVGLQLAGATAAGATDGHASCLGIEASDNSPPGSSDEFPGGMSELVSLAQDLADQYDTTPGAIFSGDARRHAGSHEACDAGE
jgi:hypothetical protein